EGWGRWELDAKLGVRPRRVGLPAAGIDPAAVEPGAETTRQLFPGRRERLAALIEETIEKGQRETDRRSLHHSAQHTPAAEPLTDTHLPISPLDPSRAPSGVPGGPTRSK